MRNGPIYSGTINIDSKFTVTKSFKTQPKGHQLADGDSRSAHGCQTLRASSVHCLIIGHLSTLLWSPVELQLCGSVVYFWPYCCLFVSSCVVSCLLLVWWSEMYFWCCSQWFTNGFKDIAGDVQSFSAWFYYLAWDLFNEVEKVSFGHIF